MKIQHPLVWPEGWERAPARDLSRFNCDYKNTIIDLEREIRLFGGTDPLLTHNRGLKFSWHNSNRIGTSSFVDQDEAEPDDRGISVWFTRYGKPMVLACDRWWCVRDNIRSVVKTIEALRGIDRWGASQILEQASKGLEALPPRTGIPDCWEILGVPPGASKDTINAAYRARAAFQHPDAGGSHELMAELNAARDQALRSAAP